MEMKKRVISLAACAVMLMSAAAPSAQETGLFDSTIQVSARSAPENEGKTPSKVVIKGYSANSTSVTLKWEEAENAHGYRIYSLVDGKYKAVYTISTFASSGKLTGLKSNTEYTLKVRAFNYDKDGNKIWGKSSKGYKVTTAPVSSKDYKVKSVSVINPNSDATSIKVKWGKTECDGYLIYLYDYWNQKWKKVANVTDPTKGSIKLGMYSKSKYQTKALYMVSTGGTNGYQFCVRPYNKDSAGNGVAYAKSQKAKEAHYDLTELENAFSMEYALLCKMLPKAKAADAPNYYYTYITSANKKTGAISSTKTKSYVSEASRKAYETFAKEHFGADWTDAQKLLYTINWINKNNKYDYKYVANAGGYFANVTVQKLGQCNSYNGAIAEMLTILGYKGHYMQCMTPSVRSCQHFRTEIKIGKKTYSFESGETGWMWVFEQYDEVPLSKKATKKTTK